MIVLFLAEGFEEIEALSVVDILRRVGLPVTTVGIGGRVITGAHGIPVTADQSDETFEKACLSALRAVILPGGMPGTRNLEHSELVAEAVDAAADQGAFLCAICAAPSILGKKGLLRGRRAVCYPGFESSLQGAILEDKPVAADGRIITARGAGTAVEFGLEIVRRLLSEEAAEELRVSMQCR